MSTSTDDISDLEKYAIPDAVKQYYEEFDKHAKKQFEQCKRYQNVKHEPEGWTKVPMKQRESSGGQMHYLMGRTSPFHCELMISKDRQRILMAVYFGPYTSNGRNSLGTGQGGAQASVFDFLCAMTCASAQPKPAPTGTLTTRMKAPARPEPGVFRAEAWLEKIVGRKITIKATLSNGDTGQIFSEAEATHIIVKQHPSFTSKSKM